MDLALAILREINDWPQSGNLTRAKLVGAIFNQADWSGASLYAVQVQGVHFTRACLTDAYGEATDLQGALLTEAILPR